ncbi:MAG: glycosyltransferase family 4 protein [Moorellales bacterium]
MRVLVLTWEYPPHQVGGLGRHVAGLSRALADLGPEVHVLTRGEDGEERDGRIWVHRVRPYDVESLDFPTWVLQMNLALLERVMQLWPRQGPFDLLHAHDWLVAFCARALKHAWRRPLVATIHATEAGRNQGLHNPLQHYISRVEWWLTYEAWRVIVCSRHMRREVQGLFQLPEDKIKVIPNAVEEEDPPAVEPGFKERFAHPAEKIVFFVGRLVREKGAQVLLEAAPQVLSACPQAKFVIAGEGPQKEELARQAQGLGIGPKVYLTGYIDDQTLHKLYACAAVSVFPSLYEPFGIVALEAMAAGCPVVVSDTGGLGEIVRHAETGLKALPGNAFSLANQITYMLQHPDRAREMADRARETVRRLYNWPLVAGLTLQVYREVLRSYRASRWGRPAARPAPDRWRRAYSPVAARMALGAGRYASTGREGGL